MEISAASRTSTVDAGRQASVRTDLWTTSKAISLNLPGNGIRAESDAAAHASVREPIRETAATTSNLSNRPTYDRQLWDDIVANLRGSRASYWAARRLPHRADVFADKHVDTTVVTSNLCENLATQQWQIVCAIRVH